MCERFNNLFGGSTRVQEYAKNTLEGICLLIGTLHQDAKDNCPPLVDRQFDYTMGKVKPSYNVE